MPKASPKQLPAPCPKPMFLPSTRQIADLRLRERELIDALSQRVAAAVDDMLPEARLRIFAVKNLRKKIRVTVELEHDEPASLDVKLELL
jgi:hypothetical protein